MELRRQLEASYPTGWKIKHKLMQATQERDSQYLLNRIIHVADAYFGGELSGGRLVADLKTRFRLSRL